MSASASVGMAESLTKGDRVYVSRQGKAIRASVVTVFSETLKIVRGGVQTVFYESFLWRGETTSDWKGGGIGKCSRAEEGKTWVRGWEGEAVDAFVVAQALVE